MRKAKLGAIPERRRTTPLNEYRWTLEAEITEVTKEKTLIINMYYKNNQNLNYRTFLNKDDYITQDFQSLVPEWRIGRLVHYASYDWWIKDIKGIYIEQEYKDIIVNFLDIHNKDVINGTTQFQDQILQAKILKKEKRITDPIDKKMEEIKDLPKDFNDWLENDVFIKSRYIYYQYEARVNLKGYCTHCKNDVTVYKPKHNASGICPNCGANITYKSIGKSTKVQDERRAAVFQKTSDGFVIRYFYLRKCYGRNYKNPYKSVSEVARDFYSKNLRIEAYEYSMFKNKYMRWNRSGEMHSIMAKYNVYYKNIKNIIKDTKLQYSELGALAGNKVDFRFNVDAFITKYKTGSIFLEHFIKVGLYNLARDVAGSYQAKEINPKGKNLNAILGIQNDDIKILKKANVTLDGLNLFKTSREQGKRLTAEQLTEIMEQYYVSNFKNIFKYVPVLKALRYLREQPEYISEKDNIYNDYLNSCITLKQDMKNTFVLFPKDLKMAHDVNVDIINEKNNQAEYKRHNTKYSAIKKMNKELNNLYYYEDKQFLIRAPENAAEIVKEGQSLHHCVGGGSYSERMASKSIAILFLRDKENPQTSYYTLEISRTSNEILQCHGYRNKDSDKARINPFLRKFKRDKLDKVIIEKKAV